ncbi:hypothetical protein N7468_004707 [Penicillium chermesinum]|uniref:Uncharacterized protein n=1 Tax=Penicillium chermesinum TaxID=63820 RepID=A0A9W9PBC0_9EURO|nr:uncharacterized protein N7468_004707 [Penicillium chermesinum]KAJ5240088.1 hypothetical protein N7468_004707 [Penicillium chermesinum]
MASQSYGSVASASLRQTSQSDATPNFPNASRAPGSVPLAELSAQVQSLLSQISAQNVRLSSTLSQFSDEILRSGGRLAYEVEVLRGEAIGLSETLTEVLRDDIQKFVPAEAADTRKDRAQVVEDETPTEEGEVEGGTEEKEAEALDDPVYITNLRTLNKVRSRLEDVVQTFGDAMEWPLPPSETSFSSSFISVSGPEIGIEGSDQEEKGQQVMKKLRTEVIELLDSNGGGRAGLEAASQRVETLRNLATVWRGTAEDKARQRFVDNLGRLVDERRRTLDHQQAMAEQSQRAKSRSEQRSDYERGPSTGGFLQRLKEEIYLE